MKSPGIFDDRSAAGFTLIELLLVLGIFFLIGVAVTPLYGNLTVATQLNEETSQLVQTIRIARERSLAGYNNLDHGVCFQLASPDRYLLYQGASCAARVVASDRVTALAPALDLTSTFPDQDLHFSRGVPAVAGAITLTHSAAGGTRTINVNEIGLVEEN